MSKETRVAVTHSLYNSLAVELNLEIFLKCSPFDLVILAQTNKRNYICIKTFQRLLFADAYARLEVPSFPVYTTPSEFYRQWNDFSYAAFLFEEPNCSPRDITRTARVEYQTFYSLAWRTKFHDKECQDLARSPRKGTTISYQQHLESTPVGEEYKYLRAHRSLYHALLPRESGDLFLTPHVEATDAALHDLKDESWYQEMNENQGICDSAIAGLDAWRQTYACEWKKRFRANLRFVKRQTEKAGRKYSTVIHTPTVKTLIQAFARDQEYLTLSVWHDDKAQIYKEYDENRVREIRAPLRPRPGCRRCTRLKGHSLQQHIGGK